MFRELYPIARHAHVVIAITPAGERLRVFMQFKPKDGEDAHEELNKPLSVIGTPEELDTQLPAELEKYAVHYNAACSALGLPTDALDEAAKGAEKKPAKKAEKAKPAAAPKTTPKATAKPAARGARKVGTRPAKAASTPSKAAPRPGRIARPAGTAKHPRLAALKPKFDKATQEQCAADGRAYLAAIDAARPSRIAFIAYAQSGRRYEKYWSSFNAFMAALRPDAQPAAGQPAEHPAAEPSPPPATSTPTGAEPEQPIASTVLPESGTDGHDLPVDQAPAPDGRATETVATSGGTLQAWPFPGPEARQPHGVYSVRTPSGRHLGAMSDAPMVGDTFRHSQLGDLKVVRIDGSTVLVDEPGAEPALPRDPHTLDLVEALAGTTNPEGA